MHQILELSIGEIVKHFITHQPVIKLANQCFHKGVLHKNDFELVKHNVTFIHDEGVCSLRIHEHRLVSDVIQDIVPKQFFINEEFDVTINDEKITVFVEYDKSSLWYTIKSPKFDQLFVRAAEVAKE